MCLLCVLCFGLEYASLGRNILGSESFYNELANFRQCHFGKRHGVGAHVSDQTDVTLARQFNTFIQFLCDPHRPLRVEAELAR